MNYTRGATITLLHANTFAHWDFLAERGKRRYDKGVSTRSIFDLGVSWESSTAADVLLPKYASSTRKIHPLEVSAHISNRLFVLENTRRVHGCLESIYNKVWFFFAICNYFIFFFLCSWFFQAWSILLYYVYQFYYIIYDILSVVLYMIFYFSFCVYYCTT